MPWALGFLTVLAVGCVVYVLLVRLYRRWWFGDNTAALRVHVRRKALSDAFGVRFTRVRRDGRMPIAPRDTERFQRDGFADELAHAINTPVTVRIHGGFLELRTPVEVPEVVNGDYVFEPKTGTVTIGVDKDTGGPARVSLKEVSGVVVGGIPGSGKSVLLEGMKSALREYSQIFEFDGKVLEPDEFNQMVVDTLQTVRRKMQSRLRDGLDFWNIPAGQRPDLLLVIIDEVQTMFTPKTSAKKDKDAVVERERIVQDLVARGRSAGVLAILATQRPVVTALPSSIREVSGVRIAGCVKTDDHAELILGSKPQPGEPSPKGVPRGEFVVSDGGGNLMRIQAFAPASVHAASL